MKLLPFELGLVFWTILFISLFAIWLFALTDIFRSEFRQKRDKVVWASVVILFPFLGVVLYYLLGRSGKLYQ